MKKELINCNKKYIVFFCIILLLPPFILAEENQSAGFFESLFSDKEDSVANLEMNYSEPTQAVSSKHISLSKENYQPKETLQAEISGNFISLIPENILIYEEGIPRPTPVIYELTKQKDKYYYYAILPDKEGNFSLKIQNAEYTDIGEIKTEDIVKDFIIKKTDQIFLAITPGFIIANKTFSIKIQSPYKSLDIITSIEATGETKNYSLREYIEETLDFSVAEINTSQTNLKIIYDSFEYSIPIFVVSKIKNIPGQKNESINISLEEPIEEANLTQLTQNMYCSDIGKLCTGNETCNGETTSSLEGPCCKGDCIIETTSNAKPVIGVLILLFILGGVWILYSKAKKKQNPKSTEEILKEKAKSFREKMSNVSEEVLGKLKNN